MLSLQFKESIFVFLCHAELVTERSRIATSHKKLIMNAMPCQARNDKLNEIKFTNVV